MSTERIHIANSKGGVAKTTFAVNLAVALSSLTKENFKPIKVLLVDIDPQSSASCYLLGKEYFLKYITPYTNLSLTGLFSSILGITKKIHPNEILIGRENDSPIFNKENLQSYENLHLISSHPKLKDIEIFVYKNMNKNERISIVKKNETVYIYSLLSEILSEIESDYDYVILDSPSNLSFLNLNALYYADSILIPVIPDGISFQGMELILNEVKTKFPVFQNFLNKKRILRGVVFNNWEQKINIHSEYFSRIEEEFHTKWKKNLKEYLDKDFFLFNGAKRSAKIPIAYEEGRPIDDGSPVSENFRAFMNIATTIRKGWKK